MLMLFGEERKRCGRNTDFNEIRLVGFSCIQSVMLSKLLWGDVCTGFVRI